MYLNNKGYFCEERKVKCEQLGNQQMAIIIRTIENRIQSVSYRMTH